MATRQANGLNLRVQSIAFYVRRDIGNTLDVYGHIFHSAAVYWQKRKDSDRTPSDDDEEETLPVSDSSHSLDKKTTT